MNAVLQDNLHSWSCYVCWFVFKWRLHSYTLGSKAPNLESWSASSLPSQLLEASVFLSVKLHLGFAMVDTYHDNFSLYKASCPLDSREVYYNSLITFRIQEGLASIHSMWRWLISF